ncbi:hypothetical protein [Streptomyces tailanensis]|uniref:hypothetical protein n=1 Tax=Streptomyces tailanensis TaxID=2569858 RepID=UPI00122DD931|nr:hypothetical protein [Streptomyces tailanensis]
MTDTGRPRRFALSVAAWWMLLALVLWLLGRALDQPASFAACAASAALLVAVGEIGDGLRRRRRNSRPARRRRSPSGR